MNSFKMSIIFFLFYTVHSMSAHVVNGKALVKKIEELKSVVVVDGFYQL